MDMAISVVGCNSTKVATRPYLWSKSSSWNSTSKPVVCQRDQFSLTSQKSTRSLRCNKKCARGFVVRANNSAAGGPVPSGSSSSRNWILGMVASVILPFFTNKLGPLWVLKDRIENAVEVVEEVAETVEKVAEEVDKIAEDISDDLPEGKIKDLVDFIEDAAEQTAKNADALDDLIDKVQESEEKLESFVESLEDDEAQKNSSKDTKDYK